MELSPEKQRLLNTDGNILALGGPGSGKTFIALLKAGHEIEKGSLLRGQHILFLSFARATIARVEQQAKALIPTLQRSALEINTYHGFAWNLLRSHGYLLNPKTPIRLLPPPEAATRLSAIKTADRPAEKLRLLQDEGLLHFDLFASTAATLLLQSAALSRIISDAYPIIILDEFQDTNPDEWQLIQALGKRSRLIALADAEQRIYEFRGADPKRIGEFINAFLPEKFDFATENNRSNGTDIGVFGNDLLTGANRTKQYKDVSILRYQVRKGIGFHFDVKISVIESIRRLRKDPLTGWSIAVLVPTRQLMMDVSDYLSEEQVLANGKRVPALSHEVALETTGPALAAVLIATLLEGGSSTTEITLRVIQDLCGHIRGRKGNDTVTAPELQLADALDGYLKSGTIRGPKRKHIVEECQRIAIERGNLVLVGDPWQDWLAVRQLVATSTAQAITRVAVDAKYLRLLHKGAQLSSKLSELWRGNGAYVNAADRVREALLQEHFSAATKEWNGIHVMTIHKSKGKEFSEVIIYEGSHQGRILRANSSDNQVAQARLLLRVAVTRAMRRTTILTPKHDACAFL